MDLLKQDRNGQKVKNLQIALNYHLPNAIPPLKVDGRFGPITKARVVQFQTRYHLKMDGIVGPKTDKALYCFVAFHHHLLIVNYRRSNQKSQARTNVLAVGNDPFQPIPNQLPPLKRPYPFPRKLLPVPPLLQMPRLEIDPRLLALVKNTKFELEAGHQRIFKKDIKTGENEHETSIFANLKATVWSKPLTLLGKDLKLKTGTGMVVEHRLTPTSETGTSVYVFVSVEHDLKLNQHEIAKIAAEAQGTRKLGKKNEPPDASVAIIVGHEIKMAGSKITFNPGAYFQIQTNGKKHIVVAGVGITGTFF